MKERISACALSLMLASTVAQAALTQGELCSKVARSAAKAVAGVHIPDSYFNELAFHTVQTSKNNNKYHFSATTTSGVRVIQGEVLLNEYCVLTQAKIISLTDAAIYDPEFTQTLKEIEGNRNLEKCSATQKKESLWKSW